MWRRGVQAVGNETCHFFVLVTTCGHVSHVLLLTSLPRSLPCLSPMLACQTREVRLKSLCRSGSCSPFPVLKLVAPTLHASFVPILV